MNQEILQSLIDQYNLPKIYNLSPTFFISTLTNLLNHIQTCFNLSSIELSTLDYRELFKLILNITSLNHLKTQKILSESQITNNLTILKENIRYTSKKLYINWITIFPMTEEYLTKILTEDIFKSNTLQQIQIDDIFNIILNDMVNYVKPISTLFEKYDNKYGYELLNDIFKELNLNDDYTKFNKLSNETKENIINKFKNLKSNDFLNEIENITFKMKNSNKKENEKEENPTEEDKIKYIIKLKFIFTYSYYSKLKLKNTNITEIHDYFQKLTKINSTQTLWSTLNTNQKSQFINNYNNLKSSNISKNLFTGDKILHQIILLSGLFSYVDFNSNISIYPKTYNFLSHDPFDESYLINMLEQKQDPNSRLYRRLSLNWLVQIDFFNRFLNKRKILISGDPGIGKTTEIPKLFLFASRSLYYNNQAKVACTLPRISLVKEQLDGYITSLNTKIFSPNINSYVSSNSISNVKSSIPKQKYIDSLFVQAASSQDSTLNNDFPHPKIELIIDGFLYNSLETMNTNKNLYFLINSKTFNPTYNIIIIDEAHEHNIYMDLIITLMQKYLYYNNQTKLIIMSATLESDEPTYNSYLKNINDNFTYPFNLSTNKINKSIIPNRLHIEGKQPPIKDIDRYTKNPDQEIIKILKEIEKNNDEESRHVLLFVAGMADIKKIWTQISSEFQNFLIIPIIRAFENNPNFARFTDKLYKGEINLKEIHISNESLFSSIMSSTFDESNINKGNSNYNRILFIASPIVESSKTIVNLKYVIDTGLKRDVYYDYESNTENSEITKISESSMLQRRGRTGRISEGIVYYLYNRKTLIKSEYNLTRQNLEFEILKLLTAGYELKFNDVNDPNIQYDDLETNTENKDTNNIHSIFKQSYFTNTQKIWEDNINKKIKIYSQNGFKYQDMVQKGFFIIDIDPKNIKIIMKRLKYRYAIDNQNNITQTGIQINNDMKIIISIFLKMSDEEMRRDSNDLTLLIIESIKYNVSHITIPVICLMILPNFLKLFTNLYSKNILKIELKNFTNCKKSNFWLYYEFSLLTEENNLPKEITNDFEFTNLKEKYLKYKKDFENAKDKMLTKSLNINTNDDYTNLTISLIQVYWQRILTRINLQQPLSNINHVFVPIFSNFKPYRLAQDFETHKLDKTFEYIDNSYEYIICIEFSETININNITIAHIIDYETLSFIDFMVDPEINFIENIDNQINNIEKVYKVLSEKIRKTDENTKVNFNEQNFKENLIKLTAYEWLLKIKNIRNTLEFFIDKNRKI